jgi:hypothetical protein
MKGLISFLQQKEVSKTRKLFAIRLFLSIPVFFLHELYHFIFVWLFRVKHKLFEFKLLQYDKEKHAFHVFLMTVTLEEAYPYQLLIIGAAPYIGVFVNIIIYGLICLFLNLGPIVFSIFLIYHIITLKYVLTSDDDDKCIEIALKRIKEEKLKNNPLKISSCQKN